MKGRVSIHVHIVKFPAMQSKKGLTMDQNMFSRLKKLLIAHEGCKQFPYVDTVGKVTIGIGYDLTDRGLPQQWIDSQFAEDVDFHYKNCSDLLWFSALNADRQLAILDMSYNLGFKKMLEFVDMIDALSKGYYDVAAKEMLDSEWAKQVGNRAIQLANIVRTGVCYV